MAPTAQEEFWPGAATGGSPAATGHEAPGPGTVLGALAATLGANAPQVRLGQDPSGDGSALALEPASPDVRARSRGRGNYQILGEIARGPRRVILKARDGDLGRDVAMKVLPEELAGDPGASQRFLEAAQIQAQLQHPGILPIYELGLHADGRPYCTIKLAKGRSLSALLAERSTPETDRVRFLAIFERICETMAYAHDKGVAHGTLHPRHVLVGTRGEVYVTHWDRARLVEPRNAGVRPGPVPTTGAPDVASSPGRALAATAYLPPEAVRGLREQVDQRTDAFALGAILCEILTGEPPYGGDGVELVAAASQGRLDLAHRRLEACGAVPALIELAKRCLAAGRGARPKSAVEVSQAVGGALHSLELRAQEAEASAENALAQVDRASRAAHLPKILAEGLLLLVLVGGGAYTLRQKEAVEDRAASAAALSEELDCVHDLWRQARSSPRDTALWNDADQAATRAHAILVSEELDPNVRQRAESILTTLRIEHAQAQDLVRRERDQARLLERLAEIRIPVGEACHPPDDSRLATEYATIFEQYGLDPEQLGAEQTARRISELPASGEILAAFDEWACALYRADPDALRVENGPLAVALRADSDAERTRLREAVLAGDLDHVRRFVAEADLRRLPPATAELLGAVLTTAGDVEAAVRVLQAAQAFHPGDFGANLALARVLESTDPQRFEEATRFYTAALVLRPESLEVRQRLSHTLEHTGDVVGAMGVLHPVLEERPEDGALEARCAALHWRLGEKEQAVAGWRAAAALDLRSGMDYGAIADRLLEAGDVEGALAALGRWTERWPADPEGHYAIGVAQRDAAADELAAARAFRRAGELDPGGARSSIELASIHERRGEIDAAIEQYVDALRADPGDVDVQFAIARVFALAEDWDSAVFAYVEGLRLDPDSARAAELGALCERTDDPARILAAFQSLASEQPESSAIQRELGRVLLRGGDHDRATTALARALQLDPNDADAYSLLGKASLQRGDPDAATEWFDAASRLAPEDGDSHYQLGLARAQRGQLDSAIVAFREAVARHPEHAEAHFRLAITLQRKGALEAARASYDRALELQPDHAEAYCNLGGLLRFEGQYAESLAAYRRGHDLGTERPLWRHPSERWVREAEQLVEQEGQLEAVLRGGNLPASTGERLALAVLAGDRRMHGTSARLFAAAFEGRSEADDLANRYEAARAAALAACGQGTDAEQLDEADRAGWRRVSLTWLDAELDALVERSKGAEAGTRAALRVTLEAWQVDESLEGLRNEEALADLTQRERLAWRALWNRVERIVASL